MLDSHVSNVKQNDSDKLTALARDGLDVGGLAALLAAQPTNPSAANRHLSSAAIGRVRDDEKRRNCTRTRQPSPRLNWPTTSIAPSAFMNKRPSQHSCIRPKPRFNRVANALRLLQSLVDQCRHLDQRDRRLRGVKPTHGLGADQRDDFRPTR